jgi:phosphate butyryltransferase
MILKDFNLLWERVTEKKRVAVPGACDEHTLEAVFEAGKKNIAFPILIGNKEVIQKKINKLGYDMLAYEIAEAEEGIPSAQAAVDLVKAGQADLIMKGNMQTADLLRTVVSSKNDFRTSEMVSHFGLVKLPDMPKLFVMTDATMVIHPSLEDKKTIIQNAVDTLHSLGCERPKVAALCAVENVNPKMQETVDAAALKEIAANGGLLNCDVEGPISYDLAMSKEAAEIKGYPCPWCGEFDVLLVPDMVTGNILSKAWSIHTDAILSGMIVGAKCPIAVGSRSATVEDKILSLVLCAAAVSQ